MFFFIFDSVNEHSKPKCKSNHSQESSDDCNDDSEMDELRNPGLRIFLKSFWIEEFVAEFKSVF